MKLKKWVRVTRWKVLNAGQRYLALSLKAGGVSKDVTLSSFICWGIDRTMLECGRWGRREQGA